MIAITCECSAAEAATRSRAAWIAVDGVDPAVPAHDLGEGNRDVPSASTDIDACPPWSDAQAFKGDGERPAVDVVSQAAQLDLGPGRVQVCHSDES